MRFTSLAVFAFVLAAACGGNKDSQSGAPPATTTDTSAGQMSPNSNPAPASPSTPAANTPATPDTTQKMAPPPDTTPKKHKKTAH